MKTFLKENDIWCISISSTGRCNCNCSYCHVYARHAKENYTIDITDEMFDGIIDTIVYIKNNYHKNIQVRFSGGEPLVLGDRLFSMTKRLYDKTGYEAVVLSNGLLIDDQVIEKAHEAHIGAFACSIENPLNPAVGAPDPDIVLDKIKKYNDAKVEVLPGVMIIKNESFEDLKKIADYVYSKMEMLPVFSELSFHAYESPTKTQLEALYSNIKDIVKDYYGLTPLRFFPYVSPELHGNGERNFITSIELEDADVFAKGAEYGAELLFQRLNKSYINPLCNKTDCDWHEDCELIKWTWNNTTKRIKKEDKLRDFCNFKQTVNNALYDGLLENEDLLDERLAEA